MDTPAAVNYGSLGTLIGHELTHGFDETGKVYDKNGNHGKDWWTKETSAKFDEGAQCFVQQYGSILDPITGLKV